MPTIRPGGPYAVQWSHPLAAGLRDAVLFDTPQGRQIVPFGARPIVVGSPTVRGTAAGAGIKVSSGTNYAYWQPDYTLYNTDWTVSFLVHTVSIPGAYTSLIELGTSGGVRTFALFLDTSGNLNFVTFENDGWGNPGTTLGLTAGVTNRVTMTVRGSTLSLYKDTALIGSSSVGFRNNTTPLWYVGKNISGGGVEPDAVYGDLFVWPTRGLTAGEVAAFAQNPWPLITPPRLAHPALSMVDAGGAAPITGSGAVTLGAVTSSAAGTLAIAGAAAGTLGAAASAGAGALAITGASARTLAALTGASAGILAITGAGSATLGAVVGVGVGALAVAGAGASTLGGVTSAAAGTLAITGAGAVALGEATASGVGALAIQGAGGGALGSVTAVAIGDIAAEGLPVEWLAQLAGTSRIITASGGTVLLAPRQRNIVTAPRGAVLRGPATPGRSDP